MLNNLVIWLIWKRIRGSKIGDRRISESFEGVECGNSSGYGEVGRDGVINLRFSI